MPIIQLLVLAIVQGLTEFIPVSSSAHLILVPEMVNDWADQGRGIDVAAHLGSLGAVLLYFRQESANLFLGGIDTLRFQESENRRLFLFIAAGTVPLVVFGFMLAATGIDEQLRNPVIIGIGSIVFGIILWIADRRPTTNNEMPSNWRAVMMIGVAQALAIIPGTSRSGITITAARWLGYTRDQAARFSMLLAIPAIAASGFYETVKMIDEGSDTELSAAMIVAGLSFLAAWAAISIFMKLTQKIDFTPFVIYRVLLGIFLIAMFI